jgi:phage baseplate assembly protein W
MAQRYLVHPFRLGARREVTPPAVTFHNGVALTDDADQHLRDKILAVLFTVPGERVNQPRFGVGLEKSVFDGLDDLTMAALEFRISEGLRADAGDELSITNVEITADDGGRLSISIDFFRRTDRLPRNLEVQL